MHCRTRCFNNDVSEEAEFTKFRNGIGYSASELKTIERCVSSRSSSDVVTDVQTRHNDVQTRHSHVQTQSNDVQTRHKSTTIVQTASEVARGPQISRSHTGAPAFCSTHWNQGNKSEHSQGSMFLKNIVKIWPKRGRVASGLQFAGRLPVQPLSSLNISGVHNTTWSISQALINGCAAGRRQ